MNPRNYNSISDSELLQHFYNDGNNDWLGILLQRYTLLLFGLCLKYLRNEDEAKDAVQQVFLKAINELQKYRVEYFKSWIYMVAKNHCLMKFREKDRHNVEIDESLLQTGNDPDDLSRIKEKDFSLELMSLALLQLNKEQQVCVTSFYLNKKNYQQISEDTGYTLMQVKSNIQNGKRNLKILMERLRK